MLSRRLCFTAALSFLAPSCSPDVPQELSCSVNGDCPDGQVCAPGLVCISPDRLSAADGGGDPGAAACEPEDCPGDCAVWSCSADRCEASEDACDPGDTCNPSSFACEGPAPVCVASSAFDCGAEDMWCYESAPGGAECRECSSGFANCDGQNGCECDGLCGDAGCVECDNQVANSCGGSTVWCYQNAPGGPECRACSSGFYNCDGLNGCEADDPCGV